VGKAQEVKKSSWFISVKCALYTTVVAFFLYYICFFTNTDGKELFEGFLYVGVETFAFSLFLVRFMIWVERKPNPNLQANGSKNGRE